MSCVFAATSSNSAVKEVPPRCRRKTVWRSGLILHLRLIHEPLPVQFLPRSVSRMPLYTCDHTVPI